MNNKSVYNPTPPLLFINCLEIELFLQRKNSSRVYCTTISHRKCFSVYQSVEIFFLRLILRRLRFSCRSFAKRISSAASSQCLWNSSNQKAFMYSDTLEDYLCPTNLSTKITVGYERSGKSLYWDIGDCSSVSLLLLSSESLFSWLLLSFDPRRSYKTSLERKNLLCLEWSESDSESSDFLRLFPMPSLSFSLCFTLRIARVYWRRNGVGTLNTEQIWCGKALAFMYDWKFFCKGSGLRLLPRGRAVGRLWDLVFGFFWGLGFGTGEGRSGGYRGAWTEALQQNIDGWTWMTAVQM